MRKACKNGLYVREWHIAYVDQFIRAFNQKPNRSPQYAFAGLKLNSPIFSKVAL
jgi:hypothetical protein